MTTKAKKVKDQTTLKYQAKSEFDRPINLQWREYVDEGAEGWGQADEVKWLNDWAETMAERFFPGRTKEKTQVPTPVIGLKKLTNKNRLAEYWLAENEFGLRYVILFNLKNFANRKDWHKLATLLHEVVHMWQDLFGDAPKTRVHNEEFCGKLASYGIICHKDGWHTEVKKGKFTDLLDEKGVEYDLKEKEIKPQTRTPKIRWSCKCEQWSIRADEGREVMLQCITCESAFVPKDGGTLEILKAARKNLDEKKDGDTPQKKPKGKAKAKPKADDFDDIVLDDPLPYTLGDLKKMKVADLRKMGADHDIKGKSKQELIEKLESKGVIKVQHGEPLVDVLPDDEPAPKKKAAAPKKKNDKPKAAAKPKAPSKSKLTTTKDVPPKLKGSFVYSILDDDTKILACKQCDYTAKTSGGAMAHMNRHKKDSKPKTTGQTARPGYAIIDGKEQPVDY